MTVPPSPLRLARLSRGLRLADVAREADICVSYLSMIERGLVPPAPVRERITAVMGEDFFEGAS